MEQFDAPPYPPQTAAGGYAPARARRGPLAIAAWAVAVLSALLLGLITLFIIGYGTGLVPFLIGLVVATLPVPVYVTLVLWVDRYEAEPLWMLAVAFFWGALVATFIAIIVNSLGAAFVHEAFDAEAASFFGTVISAPVVEETAKAVALFALFFWKRDEFDGVLDGIVYAAMVGLGFAMTENVKYYAEAAAEGQAVGVFVVRGMFSPFAHPLFTGMTGIGLGLARQSRSRFIKFTAPIVGLALAVLLHGAWNGTAYLAGRIESGALVLLTYFLVMVPIFAGLLTAIGLALRHEGRVLREQLWRDCERGLFTHEEYSRVCSLTGRTGASFRALTSGGFGAWRSRRRLNGLASELAFHRSRVSRGITAGQAADEAREAAYVHEIYELQRGRSVR